MQVAELLLAEVTKLQGRLAARQAECARLRLQNCELQRELMDAQRDRDHFKRLRDRGVASYLIRTLGEAEQRGGGRV